MDGSGDVVDVAAVDAGNADSAVLGEVDAILLPDLEHLLLTQAGEGEHSDLVGDVRPILATALLGKAIT